jgi:hypothetical protein
MDKRELILAAAVLFAVAALSSCAPSVEFMSTGITRTPKPADYRVIILGRSERLSEDCKPLGDIHVTAGFLSSHCDFDQVLLKLAEKGREVGADAVKITAIHEPDSVSSCYRMDGVAVTYTGSKTASAEALLARPNMNFLSWDDAEACGDFGDTAMIPRTLSKVHLIPFSILTAHDDSLSGVDNYPVTESRIRSHFLMLLRTTHRPVEQIERDSRNFHVIADYFVAVGKNATRGTGSPLGWGRPIAAGLLDTSSVIYIPMAVERVSQRTVQPRFYALIADSKGRIIFARSFKFDAEKWAKEFNGFADDVEGRLPIVWK